MVMLRTIAMLLGCLATGWVLIFLINPGPSAAKPRWGFSLVFDNAASRDFGPYDSEDECLYRRVEATLRPLPEWSGFVGTTGCGRI
jgi:hypothetical protein